MQRAKAGITVVMAVAVACLLVTSSQAASKAEQQEAITKMAEQSLQQLYQAKPAARAAVEKAAGYAVFSDMGVKILFGGSGKGQGVVVNNQTGQ
jgi:lipid-binding SYLF domain-containing protein